ncbi:MAG: hypothetical protein L0220_19770 [Acidobacteria bacterium]|nr:hypothetical protein [Acidobacteriota bacterium]
MNRIVDFDFACFWIWHDLAPAYLQGIVIRHNYDAVYPSALLPRKLDGQISQRLTVEEFAVVLVRASPARAFGWYDKNHGLRANI